MKVKSKRLLSLDILRGLTIAGMILVNNPGNWGHIYAPLRHAEWHGLTPTDLIFPFFMFIMGISTYISLRKSEFKYSAPLLKKILKRTFVIFLIGLGLSWLSVSFKTFHELGGKDMTLIAQLGAAVTNFGHIRILGVMQRLAISYGAVALIVIFVKHKYIPHIVFSTLIGYFLLLFYGQGFTPGDSNILAIVDQKILGLNHMFVEFGLDPEGILSTIPSIAHVLIGFYCGKLLMERKENTERMLSLFIVGVSLFFIGYLFSYGCPINKKIWSPTFVLITNGMGAMLLALLIWIIDVKGYKKWCVPFESFGINPLFIYIFAGVMATVVERTLIKVNGVSMSLKDYTYNLILVPLFNNNNLASLVYALLFVSISWLVGYVLYKRKIYIKI